MHIAELATITADRPINLKPLLRAGGVICLDGHRGQCRVFEHVRHMMIPPTADTGHKSEIRSALGKIKSTRRKYSTKSFKHDPITFWL